MGCCCIQNLQNVDDVDQRLSDSKVFLNKNKQALILKEQGNEHFKKRSYQNAINCYRQAIVNYFLSKIKNPYEQVYYTNLAQAYRANAQYQQSIETVNKMLRINFPVSANYSDLLTKGKITKARCLTSIVKKYILNNAYNPQQTENMKQKCQQSIQIFEQIKKLSPIDIKQYQNNSLKIKNYILKIQKNTSQIQVVNYLKRKIKESKNGLQKQNNWKKVQQYFLDENELLKEIQTCYAECQRKFIQQADQDEQYLIDPITYQKFKQPVIVPSGISYQQATLKQYFTKNEYKDPITKQKFQIGQKVVVRNYSIKNYILQMGKIHQVRKQDIQLLVC